MPTAKWRATAKAGTSPGGPRRWDRLRRRGRWQVPRTAAKVRAPRRCRPRWRRGGRRGGTPGCPPHERRRPPTSSKSKRSIAQRAYLRRVAENRIRDELRRATRRRDTIAPEQPLRASDDGAPQTAAALRRRSLETLPGRPGASETPGPMLMADRPCRARLQLPAARSHRTPAEHGCGAHGAAAGVDSAGRPHVGSVTRICLFGSCFANAFVLWSRLRNSWGWRLGAVLNSPGKHPFALDRRLDAGSGGPAARREVEVGLFRRVADRASEHRWVTDAGRAPRGVAGGALVMSPGVRAGRR